MLAETKTYTDAKLYPVHDSEVVEAKAANNYFEGKIDLSSKTTWKDSLFRNCTITISNPDNLFSLENTRFVDCSFQVEADEGVKKKLVSSFLETTEPTLTVPRFSVGTPKAPKHYSPVG